MKKNGTIVNLLFALFIVLYEFAFDAVYSLVTGDALEKAARDVIYGGKTAPILGGIILAAVTAEFIGIIIKLRTTSPVSRGGGIFFLWMLHTAVTTAMVMTACKSFGADIEHLGAGAGTGLFANIIKELVILGLILFQAKGKFSRAKGFIGDACILFFYCTGFSTGWDVIGAAPGSNLHQYLSNIPLLILYTVMAMLFFLMMYLPLRLGYFMTERMESDRNLLISALSIAAVTIAAMVPLFKPLDPAALQRNRPAGHEKTRQPERAPVSETGKPDINRK